MRGHERNAYEERYGADLTSIASLDEPDLFTKMSRGPLLDYWHDTVGVHRKRDISIPHFAKVDHNLTFPFKVYSAEYALKVSRVLYAIGISVLITFAIVTLNIFKTAVGRIIMIGVHNILFTIAAAIFTKAKPGELFAVAAAYAAVLVVFASGSTGLNPSS